MEVTVKRKKYKDTTTIDKVKVVQITLEGRIFKSMAVSIIPELDAKEYYTGPSGHYEQGASETTAYNCSEVSIHCQGKSRRKPLEQ